MEPLARRQDSLEARFDAALQTFQIITMRDENERPKQRQKNLLVALPAERKGGNGKRDRGRYRPGRDDPLLHKNRGKNENGNPHQDRIYRQQHAQTGGDTFAPTKAKPRAKTMSEHRCKGDTENDEPRRLESTCVCEHARECDGNRTF